MKEDNNENSQDSKQETMKAKVKIKKHFWTQTSNKRNRKKNKRTERTIVYKQTNHNWTGRKNKIKSRQTFKYLQYISHHSFIKKKEYTSERQIKSLLLSLIKTMKESSC